MAAQPLPRRQMGNKPRSILNMERAHTTPHACLKELAANSRDAGATTFSMLGEMLPEGLGTLIVVDDGKGPCRKGDAQPCIDSFLDILDLGHATSADNPATIGEAGAGLKYGCLGIARDTLIATQNTSEIIVALLSASLHEDLEARDVRFTEIPHLVFNKMVKQWRVSEGGLDHLAAYTPFSGAAGLEALRALCTKHLGTGYKQSGSGGVLHIMMKLREGIDVFNNPDDIKLHFSVDHKYLWSARRFMGFAFPDKRERPEGKFIVKIKGRPVYTWIDSDLTFGSMSGGSLQMSKLCHHSKRSTYKPTLVQSKDKYKASITIGWTAAEKAAEQSNLDKNPFGLCILYNGMLVEMFSKITAMKQMGPERSLQDRMLKAKAGLVIMVELELLAGNTLTSAGIQVNPQKTGFVQGTSYMALMKTINQKANDYVKDYAKEHLGIDMRSDRAGRPAPNEGAIVPYVAPIQTDADAPAPAAAPTPRPRLPAPPPTQSRSRSKKRRRPDPVVEEATSTRQLGRQTSRSLAAADAAREMRVLQRAVTSSRQANAEAAEPQAEEAVKEADEEEEEEGVEEEEETVPRAERPPPRKELDKVAKLLKKLGPLGALQLQKAWDEMPKASDDNEKLTDRLEMIIGELEAAETNNEV